MKKSNYLNYLSQYHNRMPLNVQRTFKQVKKQPKSKITKTDKPKDSINKAQNFPYLSIQQKVQNKENLHPNVNLSTSGHENILKQSGLLSVYSQLNKVIKQKQNTQEVLQTNILLLNQKTIKYRPKQFHLNLTKCNFQPMHSADNLYIIETQAQKEIVVCQKCSLMFTKRMRVKFIKKNHTSKYSYTYLVQSYESLEQQNKKLRRIQFMQKENLHYNLNKIQIYYAQIIQILKEAKDNLDKQIIQISKQNVSSLARIVMENQRNMELLNDKIQQLEKSCLYEIETRIFENMQIDEKLFQRTNTQIELHSIDLKIPLNIVDQFKTDFNSSKYYIKLFKSSEGNNESKKYNEQQIQETQDIIEQIQQKIKIDQNKESLSPDFQKLLPFNVDFSISEQKRASFSHKMDDVLSKVSSSEQLLIESLRYRECNKSPLNRDNEIIEYNMVEELQKEKNSNLHNFRTQTSTHRTDEPRQQNSCSKKNFIKQLHIESNNELDDMMCDEDLTLSYSHPIYQDHPRIFFNPLHKNKSKSITAALTLSQLESKLIKQESSYHLRKSEITNPSLISASENKHEISFQLDENLIIDANILPEDNDGYQNLDIISPAFKII